MYGEDREVRVARSAYKHGVSRRDIATALTWMMTCDLVGEEPDRWLVTGFDSTGRALEIVQILGDDGGRTVIHAMRMRPQYDPTRRRR